MFEGCAFKELVVPISKRGSSSPTSTSYNFIINCKNLEKLTWDYCGWSTFNTTTIQSCPNLKYMYLHSVNVYGYKNQDFSALTAWGTGSEENRQSVLKTISSFNKEGETNITITLSSTTMNLLTEEEIAELTANNITLASA
jgi:hypothetical protein